jgi:hypothetical protein
MAIPGELKHLDIKDIQRGLLFDSDPDKRFMIERLLAEEQAKDDSTYSSDPGEPGQPTSGMRDDDAHNATGG